MAITSFSDSIPVYSDPALFAGLWLHYPDDPQGSSTQFLIGRDLRSYNINVGGRQMTLAGREFPVSEFGEHRNDQFSVQVIIPHGPTYYSDREALREFSVSKRTVVARDNRGVVIFGTIGELDEDHRSEGSGFSFDVTRVHREEVRVD